MSSDPQSPAICNEYSVNDVSSQKWLGFLVRQEYAPSEVVSGFLKNTLLDCDHAFKPYIKHRQSREDPIGVPSVYAQHFEWVIEIICKKQVPQKQLEGTRKRTSSE